MKKRVLTFFMFLLGSIGAIAQHYKTDSIISTIKGKGDSLAYHQVLLELHKLWSKGRYDTILSYEDKLFKLGKQIGYNKGIGNLYLYIGNSYGGKNQIDKAYENYDKAIHYYTLANHQMGIAFIHNNKSTIEQAEGNLKNAIMYIHKANLYFEKAGETWVLSSTYHNLANIYADIKEEKLAEEFYLKAIQIKRKDNSIMLPSSLNHLGGLYAGQQKFDEAENLFLESLKHSKASERYDYVTAAYGGLGSLAKERKDFTLSRKYFDSSLTAANKSQNQKFIADAKMKLGEIEFITENYFKAEKWFQDSRKDLEKLETVPLLLSNYRYLAAVDSVKGNFKNAFLWQKKYQKLSDESIAKENADNIAKAEKKYKSDLEEEKLKDEQEKRELLAKQELYNYKVFTGISLLIAATFFIFLLYVIKSRRVKKRFIKELNESNQIKNKLFSIISHDLKNEVHGLEGSLNLLRDDFISSEEFKEIVPLLANRTHQTSILLNNLLNWSKSQMKELHAKPKSFLLNEVIDQKFVFFEPKAALKDIKLINQLEPNTNVYADKDMLGIVAQNLIANAIKFCKPKDIITLTSVEKHNDMKIYFKDSGVGIAQENIHKLFAEETYTTMGTDREKGTGLGLRICKELVELNNGTISVQSALGKGTTFTVTLPKHKN